jgi:sulfotransferase 6B1
VSRRVSQAVADSPVLRKFAVPAYRAYARYLRIGSGPRVLANGVPKGGTHLLTSLLDAFSGLAFSGYQDTLTTFRLTPFATAAYEDEDVDWEALRTHLRKIPGGQYSAAHFPFVQSLQDLLDELGIRHIVIIRDPRDIAVSDASYIRRTRRHLHHGRVSSLSEADALSFVISGVRNDDGTVGLGSISDRMANYARWIGQPGVYVCRFEDLVGPTGGGDGHRQAQTIREIAEHIGRPLSDADVGLVAARVWNPESHTFRGGRIGGWRDSFADSHRSLFKETAGDWLVRLNYEGGYDW